VEGVKGLEKVIAESWIRGMDGMVGESAMGGEDAV
jgi:hypothetical protein